MKAATREGRRERMISIMALVLVISICFLLPKAAAQSDKYSKMAPVDQYLMERNAEILLARSNTDQYGTIFPTARPRRPNVNCSHARTMRALIAVE
jgi:hypothetical protein